MPNMLQMSGVPAWIFSGQKSLAVAQSHLVKRAGSILAAGIVLWALTGCTTVKPPPERDAFNEYVPGKDIGATPGSPDNPHTGWNDLVVMLLQLALPPK